MSFSSVTFLFFFLPTLLLALYPCSGKRRNMPLLAASLFFYSWGEGIYLLLLLISIGINYWAGKIIAAAFDRGVEPGQNATPNRARVTLLSAICANLALLSFYKYANFLTENLNWLLTQFTMPTVSLTPIHLPAGISFFTFQGIAYLIDAYRRQVETPPNLTDFALYMAFFPKLLSGPIIRYGEVAPDMAGRPITAADYAQGIERFIFGLAKKILLANPLGQVADHIYALPQTELSCQAAWLAAACYMLQIYYDFSGYSDMAIGLGRIFGFRLPENFNYPYIAPNIQEFWRRWHITLSSWFRDYLYIPLGGNRCGQARILLNLLIVFSLCGLWHGASWTFVFWGLYHGFFMVGERLAARHLPPAPNWLAVPVTIVIVMIGWVFFRCDTLAQALGHVAAMFGLTDGSIVIHPFLSGKFRCEFTLAVLLAAPLFPWLRAKWARYCGDSLFFAGVAVLLRPLGLAALLFAAIASLAASGYNPFIYFRF
ncbi:MAG: MBOAT family protein [Desulfobulbaceae bacterium]|jgi:alginate O-acetyltransferase complex protein AlgI|nr:MBOAT family protein [Desulfobulbaceae bacterium]